MIYASRDFLLATCEMLVWEWHLITLGKPNMQSTVATVIFTEDFSTLENGGKTAGIFLKAGSAAVVRNLFIIIGETGMFDYAAVLYSQCLIYVSQQPSVWFHVCMPCSYPSLWIAWRELACVLPHRYTPVEQEPVNHHFRASANAGFYFKGAIWMFTFLGVLVIVSCLLSADRQAGISYHVSWFFW